MAQWSLSPLGPRSALQPAALAHCADGCSHLLPRERCGACRTLAMASSKRDMAMLTKMAKPFQLSANHCVVLDTLAGADTTLAEADTVPATDDAIMEARSTTATTPLRRGTKRKLPNTFFEDTQPVGPRTPTEGAT